eukprot:1621562-Alexandrium_andersonii.AAC.1
MHSATPVAVLRVDGLAVGEAARAQVDTFAVCADLELSGDRLPAAIAAHLRHPHIVGRASPDASAIIGS